MFTSMRNIVTNKAIRPGTMSTGIKNPMNEATVSRPVGRYVFMRNGVGLLFKIAVKPLSDIFSCLLVEKYQLLLSGFKFKSNFSSWRLSDTVSIVVMNS